MKTTMHLRGRAAMRVNPQQIAFELKHRVVLALNKIADRDTFQIGNEELERIAEGLTPEGVVPFLSCVTETDQEQKIAVRKECVRIMGTLARFHGEMLGPHLGKIIGSIVKRLKDQDSAVKDACVEAVGILASNLSNCGAEGGGPFSALVKPLFEALGEQNKQVQSGSALCLARVIDNTIDPPVTALMRILTRTIKLLKSRHVMAKPALIELIRSIIIQAGGASTQLALSAAVNSIQETLKSNDWTTRKAASAALAGIAATCGSMLDSFKDSCILSLESCRFDKVKPVRDSVMQAIHYWKSLPGTEYPEYSEAGSSTKENFSGRDCMDVTDISYGGWKGNPLGNISSCSAISSSPMSSMKRRTPLAVRKTCLNHEQINFSSKSDWHIGITLPKIASMADACNEESEGSCITKTFEQMKETAMKSLDSGYEYEPGKDDKPECSSASDIVSGNFETKEVTVAHSYIEEDDSPKVIGMNDWTPAEENYVKSHSCSQRVQDHKNLDSTVTDVSSRRYRVCCLHSTNELAFIRQKLLEIDTKQLNLLDLVQVFIGNTVDGLSALHSKVLGLEQMVGRMAQDVSHNQKYFNMVPSKHFRNNQSVCSSPRFSNCTPRPSVDTNYRASPLSVRCRELWDETTITKSRSNTSSKPANFCREPTRNVVKNPIFKGVEKNVGDGRQSRGNFKLSKAGDCTAFTKKNLSEDQKRLWKRIKDFLCGGDLEYAFLEALCCDDVLILIELMNKTGPVLEQLSHQTAGEILSTIASQLLEQRFLDSVVPWLHQVVDLSTKGVSNYFLLSAKAKREFLSAMQEIAAADFANSVDERSIAELALQLQLLWMGDREQGKCKIDDCHMMRPGVR